MILPFIKRSQAYEIIRSLVPEMQFNTAHAGMPMRGFHRHFLIPTIILVIAGIVGWYFWSAWSFVIMAVLIILFVIVAILYVRFGGYNLENDELVIQKHHYSILKDITLNLIK